MKQCVNHLFQKGHWGFCSSDCEPVQDQSGQIIELADGEDVDVAVAGNDQSYDGTILPTPENHNDSCGLPVIQAGGLHANFYPFLAAIGIRNTQQNTEAVKVIYACAGNLINRRYVLTAAHCHSERDPIVEVLLGANDFKTDKQCRGGDEDTCNEGEQQTVI